MSGSAIDTSHDLRNINQKGTSDDGEQGEARGQGHVAH